jgi:hypothetical protein
MHIHIISSTLVYTRFSLVAKEHYSKMFWAHRTRSNSTLCNLNIWSHILKYNFCQNPNIGRYRGIQMAVRLSAKVVTTFEVRGCHVVNVTDPYGRILGFLDRSHYFFFQVANQLYSRGWVDPLLLRKSGSSGNQTRTSGSVARWNSDH